LRKHFPIMITAILQAVLSFFVVRGVIVVSANLRVGSADGHCRKCCTKAADDEGCGSTDGGGEDSAAHVPDLGSGDTDDMVDSGDPTTQPVRSDELNQRATGYDPDGVSDSRKNQKAQRNGRRSGQSESRER